MAHDRKYCCTSGTCRDFLRANLLVILTLLGVVVGFFLGFGVRPLQPSEDAVMWIGAGVELTEAGEQTSTYVMDTQDIFADLIRNLFPDNIVTACFQKAQTEYSSLERQDSSCSSSSSSNSSGQLVNHTVTVRVKTVATASSTNVLGLVVCCMIFGMAISAAGKDGTAFYNFFSSANELIMRILKWFVWVTPIGVASLITVPLLETGHLGTAIRSLGMFSLTVVTSLALYQLLVVPVYFFLLTRQNAFTVLLTLGRPWIVSFAAASSAIAIPETIHSLEEVSHVDRRVTRFVVPFASSLNRDGTCAFVTVACIFIAQLNNIELDAARLVLIWVLTALIAMATPSVPSASIVTILIILTALTIPSQAIGLLFATEWILDRLRSASNMLSHAYCAKTTFHLCKNLLQPLPRHDVINDVTIDIDAPSSPSQDVIGNNIDVTDKLLSEKL